MILFLQQLMTHHQEWSTQSTTEKQDEVSSQLVSVIDGEGKAGAGNTTSIT